MSVALLISSLLITTLMQDPNGAAAGSIAWSEPAPPVAEAAPAPPPPTLPAWALADPFAWERAQCSPLIRKDATMEACQARVRTDLAANLGDALPAALRPAAVQECRRTEEGYAVDCGAPERPGRSEPVLREQDCGTRMVRQREGGAAFTSDCRPVGSGEGEDGLRIRLGGND